MNKYKKTICFKRKKKSRKMLFSCSSSLAWRYSSSTSKSEGFYCVSSLRQWFVKSSESWSKNIE